MAQGMGAMPRRPGYGGNGTLGGIVDPMRQNGLPLNPDLNLLRVLGPSSPNTGRVLPNDNGFRVDPYKTHFTNIYNSLPGSAQRIYDNMSPAQKIAFERYTYDVSKQLAGGGTGSLYNSSGWTAHTTDIHNALGTPQAQQTYDAMSPAEKIAFEKYTFGQSQKRIPVDSRYRNDQMYANGGKRISNNIGQNAADMILKSRLRVPSGAIKPPNGPRF